MEVNREENFQRKKKGVYVPIRVVAIAPLRREAGGKPSERVLGRRLGGKDGKKENTLKRKREAEKRKKEPAESKKEAGKARGLCDDAQAESYTGSEGGFKEEGRWKKL